MLVYVPFVVMFCLVLIMLMCHAIRMDKFVMMSKVINFDLSPIAY